MVDTFPPPHSGFVWKDLPLGGSTLLTPQTAAQTTPPPPLPLSPQLAPAAGRKASAFIGRETASCLVSL